MRLVHTLYAFGLWRFIWTSFLSKQTSRRNLYLQWDCFSIMNCHREYVVVPIWTLFKLAQHMFPIRRSCETIFNAVVCSGLSSNFNFEVRRNVWIYLCSLLCRSIDLFPRHGCWMLGKQSTNFQTQFHFISFHYSMLISKHFSMSHISQSSDYGHNNISQSFAHGPPRSS